MPTDQVLSRRERLRAEALQDIPRHGYEQIAQGGPTALSLNGIAKAMGMSGPALYRYFASRDELLATLVTESFEDLAQALEAAAAGARDEPADARPRAGARGPPRRRGGRAGRRPPARGDRRLPRLGVLEPAPVPPRVRLELRL